MKRYFYSGVGLFLPNDPITAAQFVTIAARCAGVSPAQGQTSPLGGG